MRVLFPLLITGLFLFETPLLSGELSYTHFEKTQETSSVTVKGGGLLHTKLLSTADEQKIEPAFLNLTQQLEDLARSHKTTIAKVAKLNLYLNTEAPSELDELRALVLSHWEDGKAPALTLIPSRLPDGNRLAADAVIAISEPIRETAALSPADGFASLERDIIYVSGRAASGELAPATAQTMVQIFETLAHLELRPRDIAQVKAFIQPVDQWKLVEKEIIDSFDGNPPPIVYAEWTSGSRATEIEVIASAPNRVKDKGPISYFTPPEDRKSPVYSRVATIHSNEVIFFSGHHSSGSEDEAAALFAQLKRTAMATGTDLRHFAKATYYVTTPEASASLNAVRPGHYDPERPPAASKVMIRSLGEGDTQLLIDMIAAPVGQ